MKRRNFIKSIAVATFTFPTIVNSLNIPENIKSIRINSDDWREIIPIEQLKEYGVRASHYSATCVDKNGRFGFERGYSDLWVRDSEPFIIKTFKLQCLPKIYFTDSKAVLCVIGKVNSGVKLDGKEYSVEKIVNEIKTKMEYVAAVWYCRVPCLCGQQSCKEKTWIPVVRGLSKYRYNLYLKQLNGKMTETGL